MFALRWSIFPDPIIYFKQSSNREQQKAITAASKLTDPTEPLTEELPSSVILTANKEIIASSKDQVQESSSKRKNHTLSLTPNLKHRLPSMP